MSSVRAGIIGWPVSHSLSPLLHGYWLKHYAIEGSYEAIAARPEEFSATIARLRGEGFSGVNVTVPHKQAAFALADVRRRAADMTGAANLLVFTKDGRIAADNTDGTGLVDSLEQALGPASLGAKNIVLLGAGGAARGAIAALAALGVARITVLNRHGARADQLVRDIKDRLPGGSFQSGTLESGTLEDWASAAQDAWLVINTTSAGMMGNPPLDLDLRLLPRGAAVCDIVYNPLETPLLKEARERGYKTIDGLGMLMHQAAPSFQAFFHDQMSKTPEVTARLRAELVKALKNPRQTRG